MPGQRQSSNRAVVPANAPTQASQALVAVTREIDNRLAIIEASSAAGIDAQRLKLVALTAFTRVPELMACEPVSVARAIVEAGQLGLEPTGLLGGAYLVPRGGKAVLMVGYRGLVMLAMRSGEVQRVEARVVREKDAFDYGYGLEPYLRHVPSREADPGSYVAAYSVIVYRTGERSFDVMSHAEIEAVRKRSSAGSSGPWVTDWPEMAKKTVLRRHLKLAPLTVNVAAKLDEIDPEVDEHAPQRRPDTRQAELRASLQEALQREYGTAPTEGVYREVPTTDGGQAAAQGQAEPEDATAAPGGQAEPATVPEPAAVPAAAPAPTTCGASSEKLGAGPCVLPAGHERQQYVVGSTTYPPQREHEEAGGTRWTQPR